MVVGSACPARAARQHAHFRRTLRQAGARVIELPFVHGAYDSVFTKDCAILTHEHDRSRAMLATPRYAVRIAEQRQRALHLTAAGFRVEPGANAHLEGGDVVIAAHPNIALLGYGFRSERAATASLARFLGCEVVPLELRLPSLYHLDTALTVLRDGTLLFCEEAFTRDAINRLGQLGFRSMHSVARADAEAFSLNVVELGQNIVSSICSAPMRLLWEELGRDLWMSPLTEFHRAGGSAACLVARVHARAQTQWQSTVNATAAMRSTAA